MTINEYMEKKQLTQYRLAKESGLAYTTIHDICNGKAQLEGDVLNVTSSEPLYYIHINTPRALTISYHGETYNVGKGMTMLEVK